VASIFQDIANSPGHYQIMIDPAYTHVGIGVVVGADGRMWTAHDFASK
jgi:uncharacterized protein YkwD